MASFNRRTAAASGKLISGNSRIGVSRWASIVIVSAVLGACSSASQAPDLPAEPIVSQPIEPVPSGPLTAAQITKALSERTFAFSSAGRKGTITYYSDGTFSYQETGKGSGTGLWQAADGKLCEARNPTDFLPKGTPSSCNPFSASGTTMTSGLTQLTPS